MEVMLLDGDIALDRQGSPRMVEGDLAVLQRAALRLCVRRGSHPADPQFGSRLHRLRAAYDPGRDRLEVRLTLRRLGREYPLEVAV